MSILIVFLMDMETSMARFNGPSAGASAHTKMMRGIKAGKGRGCAVLPFFLIAAGLPLIARLIA